MTAGDLDKSLEAFVKALNLQMVFSVAAQLQYSKADLQTLNQELVDKLR